MQRPDLTTPDETEPQDKRAKVVNPGLRRSTSGISGRGRKLLRRQGGTSRAGLVRRKPLVLGDEERRSRRQRWRRRLPRWSRLPRVVKLLAIGLAIVLALSVAVWALVPPSGGPALPQAPSAEPAPAPEPKPLPGTRRRGLEAGSAEASAREPASELRPASGALDRTGSPLVDRHPLPPEAEQTRERRKPARFTRVSDLKGNPYFETRPRRERPTARLELRRVKDLKANPYR